MLNAWGNSMAYELIDVTTPEDWRAFHDIRRTELFEARGRVGIYSDTHPDDYVPHHHPLLLKRDGQPVGALRLDAFGDGRGAIRLVAVTAAEQGRGHGRVMSEMIDARAKALGIHTLLVNSAPTAVGFYEKTGWTPFDWDPGELVAVAEDCVQMRKVLTPAE